MPDTTWTPAVGDAVRQWNGRAADQPGPERTVERVTPTLLVMTDGTRWYRETLKMVGAKSFSARLWPATDADLVAADTAYRANAERCSAARALRDLGPWYANHPEVHADALRDAIRRVAPYLGLTVTVDADRCPFTDDDRPCLLDAGHVETGRWHTGLGWVASLSRTTGA